MPYTKLTDSQRQDLEHSLRRAQERGLRGYLDYNQGIIIWYNLQSGQRIATQTFASALCLSSHD